MSDIIFTSGTTGAPKGAMLRHGASVRAYASWADVVGLRHGDRYLLVYPFFHTAGLKSGLVASLLTGTTLVPHLVFDTPSVMATVQEERITMLPGPPAIYQTILNADISQYDFSSLRLAVTGAAVVPVELVVQMREQLGLESVVTGYGLTETTGIVTMCRHDDDPEIIANTSGRPIPGVEVKIVDADGDEVPDRRAGRDRRPRLPGDDRLLRQPRGDRRDHRRRRLAAHRRRRLRRRGGQRHASPTASRTCSSSAASTRTRPRSRA